MFTSCDTGPVSSGQGVFGGPWEAVRRYLGRIRGSLYGLTYEFRLAGSRGALRLLVRALQQTQNLARSFEQGVQEVVEVLQPGPMGGTAARWDAQRRADADRAVHEALGAWRDLQQRHRLQQQQQQ